MKLISWNIQWGRDADGAVDLRRTVATLRSMVDFDVLCLQEVTRGFTDLRGKPGPDQVAELEALLPEYRLLYAPGVDRLTDTGAPRQFGNLVATRLPLREIFRHALPFPADPDVASMPRVALEATLMAGQGGKRPLRVICTHLEFYSKTQRAAQAEALRNWHSEACARAARPGKSESRPGPFTPEPGSADAILCGDFNSKPDDIAYKRMLEPFDDGTATWRDAWCLTHPGQPHAPTCAMYDKEQWPEPPFACDFMLVTETLAGSVQRCEINDRTRDSDHQPILLELAI